MAQHLKEQAEKTESSFSPRRLMILVWTMPVLFLIIGVRIAMKVISGEEHAAAKQEQVAPADDSTSDSSPDSSTNTPPATANP